MNIRAIVKFYAASHMIYLFILWLLCCVCCCCCCSFLLADLRICPCAHSHSQSCTKQHKHSQFTFTISNPRSSSDALFHDSPTCECEWVFHLSISLSYSRARLKSQSSNYGISFISLQFLLRIIFNTIYNITLQRKSHTRYLRKINNNLQGTLRELVVWPRPVKLQSDFFYDEGHKLWK